MFGKLGLGKKKDAAKEAAPRASAVDPSRPQQPELDGLINEMLEKQGDPPHVRRPCPASARRGRPAAAAARSLRSHSAATSPRRRGRAAWVVGGWVWGIGLRRRGCGCGRRAVVCLSTRRPCGRPRLRQRVSQPVSLSACQVRKTVLELDDGKKWQMYVAYQVHLLTLTLTLTLTVRSGRCTWPTRYIC